MSEPIALIVRMIPYMKPTPFQPVGVLIVLLGAFLFNAAFGAPETLKQTVPAQTKAERVPSLSFGGERHNVVLEGGGSGFVILPKDHQKRSTGKRPWVWYAPTFMKSGPPSPENGWLFSQLLDEGFCIAGVDVGESYGNPTGRETFTRFYNHVRKEFHLSSKPSLLPQSRGGLMLYNWAVEHPRNVQCIGGIYTVCNLVSYPGLDKASAAYATPREEFESEIALHNPIDRLAPLAKARVPIFHIHGDADKIVPLEQNAGELVRRYKAMGGPAKLIIVPGKGHQVCPEFFQSEALLDFFVSNKGVKSTQPIGSKR